MNVTGTDFVTVFVKDFEAATLFYGELLGLERTVTYGKADGAEFETGNLTLQVMHAESIGREFEPSTHPIAFRVEDVATAREEWICRGAARFSIAPPIARQTRLRFSMTFSGSSPEPGPQFRDL